MATSKVLDSLQGFPSCPTSVGQTIRFDSVKVSLSASSSEMLSTGSPPYHGEATRALGRKIIPTSVVGRIEDLVEELDTRSMNLAFQYYSRFAPKSVDIHAYRAPCSSTRSRSSLKAAILARSVDESCLEEHID
jgi:hypothetical protein